VSPGRPSLFCDTGLAARIERAEAGLVAEASAAAHRRGSAGFVTGLAGGVAGFAEAGSPFNKVARLDGAIAGGAALRVTGRIAQFSGAATVPAHRRRGVQSALLAARLADAAAAGCDIAVVTTAPGTKSQQNAQRCGFDLLYTRVVLVRPPEPEPGHEPASFGPR